MLLGLEDHYLVMSGVIEPRLFASPRFEDLGNIRNSEDRPRRLSEIFVWFIQVSDSFQRGTALAKTKANGIFIARRV